MKVFYFRLMLMTIVLHCIDVNHDLDVTSFCRLGKTIIYELDIVVVKLRLAPNACQ